MLLPVITRADLPGAYDYAIDPIVLKSRKTYYQLYAIEAGKIGQMILAITFNLNFGKRTFVFKQYCAILGRHRQPQHIEYRLHPQID